MLPNNRNNFLIRSAIIVIALIFFVSPVYLQRIAILIPEPNELTKKFVSSFERLSPENFKILDASLSKTAFSSVNFEKAFNLSQTEAKNIGQATGSDFFLMVRAETIRRFSLEKKDSFESYAAVYVVSSRTGRLVFWNLVNGESEDSKVSEALLLEETKLLKAEIAVKIADAQASEINEAAQPKREELPDENSPDAIGLRPPLPFRRVSPKYTNIADFYGVEATVDILVDIAEDGKIIHTEITRWAGFGLDESVTATVAGMNWRPADRNGKRLPMRVLLRYNFKKTEKD